MTTDVIEGTAVEVREERALVTQPGNALVSKGDHGPADMIGMATTLATALKDIVERQKLYTVINGKKFPQVEAWMTIGRMDNVVAREAERPIRNEDGSYEAFVELIRLSDGMVIGRASALCGTPDDNPWAKRGEPARRSMAVTRATSRAFRQQYSWIMALAGYQPTPAEEMVDDGPRSKASGAGDPYGHDEPARPASVVHAEGGLIGVASLGKIGPVDGQMREEPDGTWAVGFVIGEGNEKVQCVAHLTESRASAFEIVIPTIVGKRVQVFGATSNETMRVGKFDKPFVRVHLDKLVTPDETIDLREPTEAPTAPLFDDVALPEPPPDLELVGEKVPAA